MLRDPTRPYLLIMALACAVGGASAMSLAADVFHGAVTAGGGLPPIGMMLTGMGLVLSALVLAGAAGVCSIDALGLTTTTPPRRTR